MSVTEIVIYDAAIREVVNDPNGSVAAILSSNAREFAQDAKNTLSFRYISGTRNPPPGPPRRRSGDLYNSIATTLPTIDFDTGLIAVTVYSDRNVYTHEHHDPLHGQWLLDHGYKFLSFELPETFH